MVCDVIMLDNFSNASIATVAMAGSCSVSDEWDLEVIIYKLLWKGVCANGYASLKKVKLVAKPKTEAILGVRRVCANE